VSNQAPILDIDYAEWIQVFRDITNPTNERTFITGEIPRSGAGNNSPIMNYEQARAVSSALVLANMNSFPLDWAARLSVGGVHLNFFIVKQLPLDVREHCPLPDEAHFIFSQLLFLHEVTGAYAQVPIP